MIPKEKAEELFNKFYLEILDREGTSTMNGFEAKQCTLIAVDQIILEQCKSSELKNPRYQDESLRYWQEVKQEIENL